MTDKDMYVRESVCVYVCSSLRACVYVRPRTHMYVSLCACVRVCVCFLVSGLTLLNSREDGTYLSDLDYVAQSIV